MKAMEFHQEVLGPHDLDRETLRHGERKGVGANATLVQKGARLEAQAAHGLLDSWVTQHLEDACGAVREHQQIAGTLDELVDILHDRSGHQPQEAVLNRGKGQRAGTEIRPLWGLARIQPRRAALPGGRNDRIHSRVQFPVIHEPFPRLLQARNLHWHVRRLHPKPFRSPANLDP